MVFLFFNFFFIEESFLFMVGIIIIFKNIFYLKIVGKKYGWSIIKNEN